jgi:hypothetical protein
MVPPVNKAGVSQAQDIAAGFATPTVYHGGAVMSGGVTVHTVFWAPTGYTFEAGYESLIQQFFTDVAHDSGHVGGTASNLFSVLPQYGDGTLAGGITSGDYSVSYSTGADSIDDTDGFPAASGPSAGQCASPNNTSTCISDYTVQREVQNLIDADDPSGGGLHNLWFIFLPSDVDECISAGVCGSNAFAAYHSVSDLGNGPNIYAIAVDPSIEVGSVSQGNDPEGNPDAEATIDSAAHETVEAMTDPEGVGWMDSNGFEVADKCEFGPQYGPPLGTSNGSPYNQVINGHHYLIQEMYSVAGNACVQQSSTTTVPELPLPQVNLNQYSGTITGNIRHDNAGVSVSVSVIRLSDAQGDPVTVAQGSGITDASGDWSVTLSGDHAVGDDRDEIDIDYAGTGAPVPNHQVILTGNGGNPLTESGWTGWTALDQGSILTSHDPELDTPSLTVAPCFQTGVFSYTINGSTGPGSSSINDFCNTQTGASSITTPSTGAGDAVTVSSNDNRAYSDVNGDSPNPAGGLVKLTVPVGETDAISDFTSPLDPIFDPSGFPNCTADLEFATVTCTGLVFQRAYTFTDGSSQVTAGADDTGTAVAQFSHIGGGDTISVSNGSRTLTTLHVAHLQVTIDGDSSALASGTCQAGDYYGAPLNQVSTNAGAGESTAAAGGSALTGQVCPMDGDATGLPDSVINQTDDASGGQTQTEVPDVLDTSPMEGETVYGSFTALAETGLPGQDNEEQSTDGFTTVAALITPAGGGSTIGVGPNADTPSGVTVSGLQPGAYNALWVLTDANGDRRLVGTRFIEAAPVQGPPGKQGKQGKTGPAGPKPKITCKLVQHHKIKCTVTYPKKKTTRHATLRVSIARGGHVAALGQGKLHHGAATITMIEHRQLTRGAWTITLVLGQSHRAATTTTAKLRMR